MLNLHKLQKQSAECENAQAYIPSYRGNMVPKLRLTCVEMLWAHKQSAALRELIMGSSTVLPLPEKC